jgi:predicted NBD/HSP70 family sugar kinase
MRIGIDLGGTKIEVAALDAKGEVAFRARRPTPQGDYPGTIAAILALVREAEAATGPAQSLGIGTPGAVSKASGRIKNSNSVMFNGMPIREDLRAALGCPVRVSNDANCFALSEAVDGAGAGAEVVFGVILGTGVGAGVVVHGHALDGANGIAGEWGHNRLLVGADAQARPCYCGRSDCVETYLSGPALARDHAMVTGAQRTTHAIAEGAARGEADCVATLERYATRLAAALGNVINILDPDVIVLGGGVSNITALLSMVPARWAPWVFSDRVDTRLAGNRHGDSSGVRGAAWLGADNGFAG